MRLAAWWEPLLGSSAFGFEGQCTLGERIIKALGLTEISEVKSEQNLCGHCESGYVLEFRKFKLSKIVEFYAGF